MIKLKIFLLILVYVTLEMLYGVCYLYDVLLIN